MKFKILSAAAMVAMAAAIFTGCSDNKSEEPPVPPVPPTPTDEFVIEASDITATSAEVSIVPKDDNMWWVLYPMDDEEFAVSGSKEGLQALVTENINAIKQDNPGVTTQEVVEQALAAQGAFGGSIKFLQPATVCHLVAAGINSTDGVLSTAVYEKNFKTLAQSGEAPTARLSEFVAGDPDGNNKSTALTGTIYVSENTYYAKGGFWLKSEVDKAIADGASYELIAANFGSDFTDENVAQMIKPEGLVMYAEKLPSSTELVFIILNVTEGGMMAVAHAVGKTEAASSMPEFKAPARSSVAGLQLELSSLKMDYKVFNALKYMK